MNSSEMNEKLGRDELMRVARMIRELGNALDLEFESRNSSDLIIKSSPIGPDEDDTDKPSSDGVEEGSIPEVFDLKAFLEMIRKAADVLIEFLETRNGKAAAAQIAENYQEIFTILKRFSEVLGPIVMLFSIAAGLCYYDYRIHNYTVERFKIQRKAVDVQVNLLMKSLKIIGSQMEQVTVDVQRIIAERVTSNSEQINKAFSQIKTEVAVAEIRLKAAEDLLSDLEAQMMRYRNTLLLRNSIVAAGFGIVIFGLFKANYIDNRTASVGLFAGAIPYCYSYFALSVDIQEILVEIQRKKMKNHELKNELEVFDVRMKIMESERSQASSENHSRQHVRSY